MDLGPVDGVTDSKKSKKNVAGVKYFYLFENIISGFQLCNWNLQKIFQVHFKVTLKVWKMWKNSTTLHLGTFEERKIKAKVSLPSKCIFHCPTPPLPLQWRDDKKIATTLKNLFHCSVPEWSLIKFDFWDPQSSLSFLFDLYQGVDFFHLIC